MMNMGLATANPIFTCFEVRHYDEYGVGDCQPHIHMLWSMAL
jgi:hypothetical protein